MQEKLFHISGIEACRADSAVRDGAEAARDSAMALFVEKSEGTTIKNGKLASKSDLAGKHTLLEIGVVVWVTEELPVAATC